MGDGALEDSIIDPLQNPRQFDLVRDLIEDAVANGFRVILGGKLPGTRDKGNFYPLTLVRDVDYSHRLVAEEQFGPVLSIIRYTSVKEAIPLANDTPNGLGSSVWGRDLSRASKVARKLECGAVLINKHGAIQPNAPFGRCQASGIGVEVGQKGLHAFTDHQVVFL